MKTPKCRYCGETMEDDSYTWHCPKCHSSSPVVIYEEKCQTMTEKEKMAYAREAAFQRPQYEIVIRAKDDDFGCICNCAVRYAVGRRTYMPSIVVGFIKPLLPKLNNRTLWCFERDLEGAGSYGDKEIDEPLWLDFLAAVKAEIAARDTEKGKATLDG